MSEQGFVIPQEWKLTPEEFKRAAKKGFTKKVNATTLSEEIEKQRFEAGWSIADAAVAKCAPLAMKKAREEVIEWISEHVTNQSFNPTIFPRTAWQQKCKEWDKP